MSSGPARRLDETPGVPALRRAGGQPPAPASGEPAAPRRGDGLQRISRLATALLGAPVSLVTVVGEDRQVFAAQTGLREPWAGRGETPLSHSFCKHVVADGSPLVVADARRDERLQDNPAIEEMGVVAYCGVPLRAPGGRVLGSFCVIDSDPREWTPEELALVEDLGGLAQTELEAQGATDDRAVVHDVRATLHGVLGGARTLAEAEQLDGDLRSQLAGVVERQARHLEDLIDMLLTGGETVRRMQLRTEPVDVRALLEDVVASTRLAGETRVALLPGPDASALADPTAVQRCVTNLVDNALKHGGREALVELAVGVEGDRVRVVVADDGHGIPAAQHDRVFERGERNGSTADGNGIGLATVRRLVRDMGGDVHLASTPGVGTRLTIVLPVA